MGQTSTKKRLNLPRAPLPRQTGGAHRVKKKTLARKQKFRFNFTKHLDEWYF